jgi:ribonuclease P protein subunit POP4
MILETQETFQILNESNALKILPKKHTVFAVTVPPTTGMGRENESDAMIDAPSSSPSSASSSSSPPQPPKVFELFGDHLCFRSYERSARKFKAKPTIQL